MCTTARYTAARPDDAIDLSRIDWDIVVVGDPERDLIAQYRITCRERETGFFIGEAIAPPATDGGPPSVTIADIVELIGAYRLASIVVEIEAEQSAEIGRRCDRVRRRDRFGSGGVPAPVLAGNGRASS